MLLQYGLGSPLHPDTVTCKHAYHVTVIVPRPFAGSETILFRVLDMTQARSSLIGGTPLLFVGFMHPMPARVVTNDNTTKPSCYISDMTNTSALGRSIAMLNLLPSRTLPLALLYYAMPPHLCRGRGRRWKGRKATRRSCGWCTR